MQYFSRAIVSNFKLYDKNEIKLLRIMKNWKPWEYLHTDDYQDKEMMMNMMNFKSGDPFPATFESYDAQKHTPAPRRASAAVHPEDQ